jgi:hypothetical protein
MMGMGHSVQLIIGKGSDVEMLLRAWPMARAVELRGRWLAIPLGDDLLGDMEGRAAGTEVGGLERALAEATASGGDLAYVETEYFGGTGGQSAMAFANGREVMPLERSHGAGAINTALRRIGVLREAGKDEFDTIGLGERRSMEDYEPDGPRRLEVRREDVANSGLPVWVVLLIVVAAIAAGVWAAMSN